MHKWKRELEGKRIHNTKSISNVIRVIYGEIGQIENSAKKIMTLKGKMRKNTKSVSVVPRKQSPCVKKNMECVNIVPKEEPAFSREKDLKDSE